MRGIIKQTVKIGRSAVRYIRKEIKKMDEFFDKLKSGAGKFKKSAEKVTKQVVRKTNDAVSQTKLSFAINETENKISEVYENIGRAVYREYLASGEAGESMIEDCKQVDKLLAEIDDLKEKVAELKQSVKCKGCGEYNKNGSVYCSKCGVKLGEDVSADDAHETEEAETAADEDTAAKRIVTIRAKKPSDIED